METIKINITDFRGIKKADIEVAGLALVVGVNAAGKTSACQAVAAALTGNVTPLAGLRKSEAGALVRSGTPDGGVVVATADGTSQIRWPIAKMTTEGTPPQASAIAAGLESVALMRPGDRARALMPYLKADPTREDLAAALPDIKPEHLDKLWDALEINGWDGAHGQARDKGGNLKGRWEQTTGERYGSKKAANWLPDDWGDELEATSEQTLQDGLAQDREFLEAAIAAHAISDDKRREMEEQAGRIDEIAVTVTDLDMEQQRISSRLHVAREELRQMPYAGPPPIQPCPHCGEGLVIDGGKITSVNAEGTEIPERDVRDALGRLDEIWDELFPAEQARLLHLMVDKVVLEPEGLDIRFRGDGLDTVIEELRAIEQDGKRSAA